jgi:prolipoprotein diacylglyceryltransferase
MRNLWLKFKLTKFYAVLVIIFKAIAKFLRWTYATQISYLALAWLLWFVVGKWLGIPLVAWGLILLFAEIKQQKEDKK